MKRANISSNTTPKTTKRLGLSRSAAGNNSKIIPIYRTPTPDSSITSVKAEVAPTEENDPKTIPINFCVTTPVSPVKSFQRQDEADPTPKQPIGEVSGSTPSARPPAMARHKLSLCKQTNETMTRKRVLSTQPKPLIEPMRLKRERNLEPLNAHVEEAESVARIESCDIKPTSDEKSAELTSESLSETVALQQEIAEIEKKIAKAKRYQRETAETAALITQWQEAGLKTIEEMQEQLLHMQDVTDILAHYRIDPGLFNLDLPE